MSALIRKYNYWADTLEFNRLLVMAVIILVHTCLVVPATLLLLLHGQAGAIPYMIMTVFSFMILVTNLSVMPVRVNVAVFVASTVAHLLMVVYYIIMIAG